MIDEFFESEDLVVSLRVIKCQVVDQLVIVEHSNTKGYALGWYFLKTFFILSVVTLV